MHTQLLKMCRALQDHWHHNGVRVGAPWNYIFGLNLAQP